MNLLQQSIVITLVNVDPVSIHGSEYYQLTYRDEATGAQQFIRINPEAFYPNPKIGDRARVNLLMGNIMGAEKLPD